jgi:hypothetical protein
MGLWATKQLSFCCKEYKYPALIYHCIPFIPPKNGA